MSDKTFRGGVPTDIELHQLERQWPCSALHEGLRILHGEIERATGLRWGSTRYQGVMDRWINRLKHAPDPRVLVSVRGIGYEVATDNQKIDTADSKMRTAKRAARKALKLVALTDAAKLDDDHKRAASHIQQNAGSTIAILNTRGPQILPNA